MSQEILFEFCLRLAAGLACIIVFLLGRDVGREFFRTLLLVILGLCVLGWLNGSGYKSFLGNLLALSGVLTFLGFVFWTIGLPRLGACTAVLILLSTGAALTLFHVGNEAGGWTERSLALASGLSSAILLGSMVAAMLLGHTYLIAPTMSMDPLRRLVWWVGGSVAGRAIVAAAALVLTVHRGETGPTPVSAEQFWWFMLAARGLIGFAGPAIIAWMVWQTTRIRATQSATGILYAGVILVFFGELLGQLLHV